MAGAGLVGAHPTMAGLCPRPGSCPRFRSQPRCASLGCRPPAPGGNAP